MGMWAICPHCNKSFIKKGNQKYCKSECKKMHENILKYGNPKGKPKCMFWCYSNKECMVNQHCPYNQETEDKEVIKQIKVCQKVASLG